MGSLRKENKTKAREREKRREFFSIFLDFFGCIFPRERCIYRGKAFGNGCCSNTPYLAAWYYVARWGVIATPLPNYFNTLTFFDIFLIMVRFSCCYLESFLSSDFFKFGVLVKVRMSSFHRSWPCMIWIYDRWDIMSRSEVRQCRKYCSTIFENSFPNPWWLSLSPFYGR